VWVVENKTGEVNITIVMLIQAHSRDLEIKGVASAGNGRPKG